MIGLDGSIFIEAEHLFLAFVIRVFDTYAYLRLAFGVFGFANIDRITHCLVIVFDSEADFPEKLVTDLNIQGNAAIY